MNGNQNQNEPQKKGSENGPRMVYKVLAVIVILIILFLAGWGTISLIRSADGAFSGLASAISSITSRLVPADELKLSVSPQTIESGESLTLTASGDVLDEEGTFEFIYDCREGVHFELGVSGSQNRDVLFCNTPRDVLLSDGTLTLTVFSTKFASSDVPLSLRFKRKNEESISSSGSVLISVTNEQIALDDEDDDEEEPEDGEEPSDNGTGAGTGTGGTPARKTTTQVRIITVATTTQSNPLGKPDLVSRILETGVANRVTNEFTATSTIKRNERAAVRFEIQNIGTKTAEGWSFNVVLPTFPHHIFHSDMQPNLKPGDKILFTVAFDSIKPVEQSPHTFIVNADPQNRLFELREDNNIVRVNLNIVE